MYTKDGVFLPAGATLTRPKFADTLELIAEQGADAFYEGKLAQDIVDAVIAEGGVLARDDMKSASHLKQ